MNCDHCGGRLNALRVRNARIIELAKQGKSRKEIMDTLGLSPRIVYTVIRKAEVKPGKARRGTKMARLLDNIDTVRAMISDGVRHLEIGAHFGVSKATVDRFALDNGMRVRAKRGTGPARIRKPTESCAPEKDYIAMTKQCFHRPLNQRLLAA